MSKCSKVRNPCKICLGNVSKKSGLQCQGACGTWVHYSCLNYTPGKIKDIKAGIIKVTCPCPDCKTSMPKEFRTDQPYSCNNQQCPANRPPKCDNNRCPINESGINKDSLSSIPCPLSKCGTDCKQHSVPQLPNIPRPNIGQPCVPINSSALKMSAMASDSCFGPTLCPSGCSSVSTPDIPGDYGGRYPPYRNFASPPGSEAPPLHVIEQLCNTVGQLTTQINDLMSKMKQVVNEKDGRGGGTAIPGQRDGGRGGGGNTISQPGPKQLCPKPCFCPSNPARRDNY